MPPRVLSGAPPPSTPGGLPRSVAVSALVAAPVLTAVSVLLQPDLGGTSADRLAALADGPLPAVSAVAFLVSQLPVAVAVVAIGALLRGPVPAARRPGGSPSACSGRSGTPCSAGCPWSTW